MDSYLCIIIETFRQNSKKVWKKDWVKIRDGFVTNDVKMSDCTSTWRDRR